MHKGRRLIPLKMIRQCLLTCTCHSTSCIYSREKPPQDVIAPSYFHNKAATIKASFKQLNQQRTWATQSLIGYQDQMTYSRMTVGVLDRQTFQGGTRGSRLCGEDRDRETENSKVCARTRDTRFIQVRVAKVANPTSCLGIKYGALRLVLGWDQVPG
jgi:hypothetical protein